MPTTISVPDTIPPHVGAVLVPDAHDIELAAESNLTFLRLTQIMGDLDLMLTVTAEGFATEQVRVPASVVRLLSDALAEMASGNAVTLSRLSDLDPELTTQEAAEVLNVSRPYVVALLEKGEMTYRKVGPQRRVRLREVLAYKQRTDIDRRAALDELAREAQEMNLGYGE